jgi:hypothetical protein
MSSWQIRMAGVLFVAFMAGCAAPVSTNIKVSAEHVAKYNDLSDLAVVTALEKNLNEAKSANMPFLAPHYFNEASQVLSECQGALGKKPKEELVNIAAKGDAILEKGRAVMAIVQYRFAKELEFKAQLEEHNAGKLLPKEYAQVMGDFSGLIEKVERERADNIDKDKEALLKDMLDLVIRAVQEGALRESEIINADSKKKNADKQAPVTYAEALRVYQESKTQIAAAHHDKTLVQRLGAEALFAARHAQQVNERVALLQAQLRGSVGGGAAISGAAIGGGTGGMTGAQVGVQAESKPSATDKISVEKIVLQEEERLQSIATALGLKDLRDRALEKQVEEIKRAASTRQPGGNAVDAPNFDARMKAANDGIKQAQDELTAKDQQLAEKAKQLETQAAQLAEKDEQIKKLKEKVDRLEWEKPAQPVKTLKPSAAKPAAKSKEAPKK